MRIKQLWRSDHVDHGCTCRIQSWVALRRIARRASLPSPTLSLFRSPPTKCQLRPPTTAQVGTEASLATITFGFACDQSKSEDIDRLPWWRGAQCSSKDRPSMRSSAAQRL